MANFRAPFALRVQNSAEVLSVDQKTLLEDLSEAGITETRAFLLDYPTTTVEDLYAILKRLNVSRPPSNLQLKAAAGILKGDLPVIDMDRINEIKTETVKTLDRLYDEVISNKSFTANDSIYLHLDEQGRIEQPIQQMTDHDLLVRYAEDRDFATSWELQRRSRDQPFIVLKSPIGKPGDLDLTEPGHEEIDLKMSLELLKACRKKGTPDDITSVQTGYMVPVYRISELDMANRVIELCPFCKDLVILNRGYCPECHSYNMTNVKRFIRKCPSYMLRPA